LNHSSISIGKSVRDYWKRARATASWLAAARGLAWVGWEFLRDSLPSHKRQRYGDMDYDWELRVDTTSATVSWRARLLGLLHSAYQPIEPDLFREIIGSLNTDSLNISSADIDFSQFTFIDIGSGKGRALLLAAEYPFRRVVGVELLPELNSIAEENLRRFPVQKRACGKIQAICGDATEFSFPAEAVLVFLFHPLPEAGLTKLVRNLDSSLRVNPRPAYVIYVNPVFEEIVAGCSRLTKMGGTHQYSVFRTGK
jgi:SAM-dependent methyltransferase